MATIDIYSGSYYGFNKQTYNLAGYNFDDAISYEDDPVNYDYRITNQLTDTVSTLPGKVINYYKVEIPTRGLPFLEKWDATDIFKPILWERVQDRWMDSNQEFTMVESDTQPSDWDVASKWAYYVSGNPSGYPLLRVFNNNQSETWSDSTIYYRNGFCTRNFFTDANINFTCTHNVIPARYWSEFSERELLKEHFSIACKPYEGAFGERPSYNISSSRFKCPGSFGTDMFSESPFQYYSIDEVADSWKYNVSHETRSNVFFISGYLNDEDVVGLCYQRVSQDGTPVSAVLVLMSVIAWTGIVRGGSFGPNSNIKGATGGSFRNVTKDIQPSDKDKIDRNGMKFGMTDPENDNLYSFHVYNLGKATYDIVQSAFWSTNGFSGRTEATNFFEEIASYIDSDWLQSTLGWQKIAYQAVIGCFKVPKQFNDDYFSSVTNRICIAGMVIPKKLITEEDVPRGRVPYGGRIAQASFEISGSDKAILEFYDGFGDLKPFTSMELYLPFCGKVDIDPAFVSNSGTLRVVYLCDMYNGNVTAQVYTQGRHSSGVIAQLNGNCAVQVPFSGQSGGVSEPAGTIINGVSSSISSGSVLPAVKSMTSAIAGSVGSVYHSNFTGSVGFTGCQDVILTVKRKDIEKANKLWETAGHCSYIGGTISTTGAEGFTKCLSVDVSTISRATGEQKSEIERLMKEGIFV